MKRCIASVLGVISSLAWGEWLNRRWSCVLVSDRSGGSLAVVVPGFRNPEPTANWINRWRVRIGVRSILPSEIDATLIVSGGPHAGSRSEADVMAEFARSELGFEGTIVVEDRSRSTWENVANVVPLVEHADRICVASQPAHALKARAYLRRQRPDLADRLVPALDHRSGEMIAVKPFLALLGLWSLRGLTRDERLGSRSATRDRNVQ